MAIEKYSTKCLVIESFDSGEHDRVYKLFTREYGLVLARATSVRKLESKLRAHVLPRACSLVTLVQGKDTWRLVGAEEQKEMPPLAVEVVQLLKRFIRGESAHVSLYDRLISFLDSSLSYDEQKARLLLYYIVLVELGYADAKIIGVKSTEEYESFTIDDLYTHLLLSDTHVRSHIRAVLKEMQL
jgi:recombinational DNA repair protein (RecF pathway)